jgi:nucleoside-diphosphate-sugar epimerase
MNTLLIGATGQIGYALAQHLSSSTQKLTVLVRDKAKRGFASAITVRSAAQFDEQVFEQALVGQDHVIYGVGLPEQFAPSKDMFDRINYDLLAVFLKALTRSSVKRLVYISTYEVFSEQAGKIRESHALEDPSKLSPYFAAMCRAYQLARDTCAAHGIALTTIHPAAVYGGRDTGDGITHYIENILNRRYLKIPTILAGRFPVVHADSLARAIHVAMDHEGAFIVSEGMTSLKDLALTLREQASCFVPPQLPKPMVYASIMAMEAGARLLGMRPLLSVSQLDFITKGAEPLADRAESILGWKPGTLADGLRNYLKARQRLIS